MGQDDFNSRGPTKEALDAALRGELPESDDDAMIAVELAEFMSDPVASRPLWNKFAALLRAHPPPKMFDD